MRKIYTGLLVLMCIILLSGCIADDHVSISSDVPITSEIPTAPDQPTTTTIPGKDIPEEEPVEETPVIILDNHWPLYLDGTLLENNTVLYENTVYFLAEEMLKALYLTADISDTQLSFTWRGESITMNAVRLADSLYSPVMETCEELGISYIIDEEAQIQYCTSGAGKYEIPEGYTVPVLMYHAVSDDIQGAAELHVSPLDMEEQLKYLTENGYSPIWFEDLANVEQYEKPVILTFDDGYLDNYTELYPLLLKYNVKVTIFVITDAIEWGTNYMKPDQVKEMAASGLVSIQSHTHMHPNLDECDEEKQREEMEISKRYILKLTGKEPYVLCYPSGRQNQTTLDVIGDYYRFGIKMNGGDYTTGEDRFLIKRHYVSRNTDLSAFKSMID